MTVLFIPYHQCLCFYRVFFAEKKNTLFCFLQVYKTKKKYLSINFNIIEYIIEIDASHF